MGCVVFTVTSETTVDWKETARLLAETVAGHTPVEPARLRWTWENCFAEGALIVSLRHEGAKVGQMVVLRHTLLVDGEPRPAGLVVDHVVLARHRSREAVSVLASEAEARLRAHGIRYALGLRGARTRAHDAHHLALKTAAVLPLHLGLAFRAADPDVISWRVSDLETERLAALCARFATNSSEVGLPWSGPGLARRLSGPAVDYAVHLLPDVMAISSPRRAGGIPHTEICAFLARDGATVATDDLRRLVRAACRTWRRPLYAYCGLNRTLERVPGLRLPRLVRPSPLVLRMRDFETPDLPALDRYQSIDTDLA